MSGCQAYLHGSALIVLDGLGIGSTDSDAQVHQLKTLCIDRLLEVLPSSDRILFDANPEQLALIKHSLLSPSSKGDTIVTTDNQFGIAPFLMKKGAFAPAGKVHYALSAATTQTNLLRILRAMTLPKAILLEGPPGVGKTSILTTLAAASGHRIVRINLSEQTDMMDLLGMDLPVPGGTGGEFQWCDGIFLQALKAGDWVLLDELNLASQSVLEGLNAVLDHRAQVFIPELDQVFDCPSTFRIFACQNPMSQGGGRKGLPASFLNRFTKVYLNSLTTEDLFFISSSLNPHIPREVMHSMIHFNSRIHHETMVTRKIGRKGFPWEFNLRDVFKWCELMKREQEKMPVVQSKKSLASDDSSFPSPNPGKYVDLIYLQRMRTKDDRAKIVKLYQEIFGEMAEERKDVDSLAAELVIDDYPTFHLTDSYVQVGRSFLPRRSDISAASYSSHTFSQPLLVLKQLLRPLSHLATCMQLNFPTILLGEASTGKTSLVRLLAQLTHNKLHEILMTSGIDSSELLGCFEQVDLTRHKKAVLNKVGELVQLVLGKLVLLEAQKASPQSSGATAMEDVNMSDSAKSASGKGNKRNRQGDISPSPSSSLSQLSISSGNSQVTELLHSWSLLDYSYLHTQHSTASSLLAKADESESAQTLSTAAFSNEQFTLLQALLNSIEKNILPALATAFDFIAPSAIQPSLLLQQAQHIQNLAHASQGKVIGNFEWIDGSLIHALEQGDWILLDNVNFCNPTVLDRLNPLLEIDGVLLVNECGLVDGKARIIKPHPNFRMILAMDPRYGEISRAMRNRCLEICLVQPIGPQPPVVNSATTVVPATSSSKLIPTAVSPLTHDLLSIVNSLGIFGLSIPEFMVSIHSNLVRFATSGSQFSHANASAASLKSISVRNLKHWSILCAQQLQTGATNSTEVVTKQPGLFSALMLTFKHSYNLSLNATRGVDTFSDQLYAFFDGEYRKLVLGQKAPSSMLAPTLWPSMSHALTNRVEAVGRDVTVQGSVLKYLAQLALGQSVSVRDVHLLHLFRQVATERSIDVGHSLSYIPDALWQFVFGLAAHPPATVKKDEPNAAKQTVILQPSNNALAPVELTAHDSQLLLPTSSLSSTFALSAHPLHPHPTSAELFHLAIVAFLEYSTAADHKDRIEWMNRELLSGLLFEQQSTSDGTSTSKHSSISTDATVARLRTEVQLAQRTLSTFYAHPLVVQYSNALSNVIERCGFDSQVMHSALNPNLDPAFLELLRINASKTVQVEINKVLALWEVVRLLIDSVYHSLHEAHIYAGVNLLLSNPSQLSLMELSYACFTNLIHSQRVSSLLSGLSSELILQIYPFWTALESFEKNLLDHGFQLAARAADKDALKLAADFQVALQEFIHVKKYFWKTIYATKNLLGSSTMSKTNSVDSMMSEIHIRWKGLSKKIRTLVALVPGLETAIKPSTASAHVPTASSASSSTSNSGLSGSYVHFHPFFLRLQSTLQGTTHSSSSLVGVKNTLWKKGGHPLLPREKALQEIEIRLQEIEQQINYNPRAAVENSMLESSGTKQSVNKKGTQAFFIVDSNFKQVLVEAYVNLKFLYLQSVDDKVGNESEEDLALKQQQHKELVSTLASLPGVLQSKLRNSIDADKQQLDSMRFHVQIVGEGEESLEDLGFDTETMTTPAVKAEDAMDVDGGEDEQARVNANFLSVNADASATTSSRFSEQSSHKKSFIMPLLLPIFDLAYLEYSRIVVAHVKYIGFVANEIKRLLATANAATSASAAKKKTKRSSIKAVNVDPTLLRTLTSSLHSALKSLLSFLPSLLLFYANKTSAISGILDAHAVKLVEMIGGSLRDELEAALSAEANLVSTLSEEKIQSLFSHIPSLIQEVQYHYANFQQSFLQSNATLLSAHSNAPLDSSFLLTPVKSLLVLDLISQSLNISLIHRHAKRIQLQLLGDYLARDLIRAPRVSKKDQSNAALVLSSAAASSAVASKHSNLHAAILELVSLTTSLHAVIVCFESYFQQAHDYSCVLNFLNSVVQQLLKPSDVSPTSFPATLPADVKQSLLKVQDPRLNSLLNSLVFPLINLILSHMNNIQAGSQSPSEGVFHLGHATLLLSLLKFYLLLPVSPVDSNQKYFVLLRDETYFSTATRMQFEWNQWHESLLTGRAYSKQLLQLQQAYQMYQSSIASFHKKVTYRRFDEEHTKPFHQLFQEFHRFANTFLDLPKLRTQFIEPMVKSTAATIAEENDEAREASERLLEELESFQTNSTEFISRIQSSFSEYPDFIVPLLTSLHAVKHGLSLMQFGWSERQQQQQRLQAAQRLTGTAADKHQVVYQTVRALVAFPFGTISSDAEATSAAPRARVVIESDTHSPGLIPPLHHLTHQPILTSIDSLCRAAVDVIKEQSIARKAAAQDAHDAGLQEQTEAIAAAAFKGRSSSFYSIRLHLLQIVLQRILLFSKVSGRLTPDLLKILDALFRTFIDIYKANEEKRALREQEEKELFKYKEQKEEVLTEEEKDKLELQALFPDYSAEFTDIVGSDALPNMDEAVEESQRREAAFKAQQEAAKQKQQDSDDEYGILSLSAEHLQTIYNTFTAIFSIQKASAVTPAVTASVTFTEQESQSYVNSYAASYEAASTLLQALSMQGLLSNSALISSPQRFEQELKTGHLFVITKLLHQLNFAAANSRENEVNAIMESFLAEDNLDEKAIAVDMNSDVNRIEVQTSELEEGIKIDGKTGTKQGDLISTSAAAAKNASSKVDWTKFPDIYHEPNMEEVRKLEKPLTLFMLRLCQLLNQYANHPILVQLIQLSHRVLNFPSSTPLMKILTGLELLLKKAEEWEKYAARFVSIKKELVELGILVARWRKMELYTWPKALASCEQVFHQSALRGWFHLYGLIHTDDQGVQRFSPEATTAANATASAAAPANAAPVSQELIERNFMQKLYEALDEFLSNSNLGELKTRMNILLGFYQQMNLEIVEGFGLGSAQTSTSGNIQHATAGLRMNLPLRIRIQHLLLNLYQFYEQFIPYVEDVIKAKKAPLEKSLREQVKLAKWDLSNYWSLKESSEKSHRKLQKYSKDYEEILQLTFKSLISKEEERDAREGDDSVNFGRSGAEVAEARRELERIEKKLQKEKAKAKKKQEKLKAAAAAAGANFQQDEDMEDAAEEEDFGLPSLALSLTIVLPEVSLYLSDKAIGDAWFQQLDANVAVAVAADDDVAMDTSSTPAASTAPTVASYQSRLQTMYHKMQVLCNKGILSESYTSARQDHLLEIEEFSIHLISRVQKLTLPEAKFSYKKKAFVDIMKNLKEMGLSYHSSVLKKAEIPAIDVNQSTTAAFQAQAASIPSLFLQSPLTSVFLKSSSQLPLSKSETYEFLRSLSKKCEAYLYRVWSGIKKLRYRATSFNKDLNAAEVQKAKGMLEHLFFITCEQRDKVSSMAVEYHTTRKWMEWIKELDVESVQSAATEAVPATTSATTSNASFPSWSTRFWSHKHLLDSLFSSAKYLQLLYSRMRDTMLTQDSGSLKPQLEEGVAKIQSVLQTLSAAKIETDAKIARLFPNLQLAHTTGTASSDLSDFTASTTTAAESCLELNDAPNAQFLLSNIEKILAIVTVHNETPSVDAADEEGSIMELPFMATTSTFNELVVSLIRSKYEIKQQAAAASTRIVAPTSAIVSSGSVSSLSTAFTSTYHSLVSALLLSVQTSFKHAKSLADAAAQRAKVAKGEAEADTNEAAAKFLIDEANVAESGLDALYLRVVNQKLHELTTILNQFKPLRSQAPVVFDSFRVALHNLVPLVDQVLLLSERALGSALNLHRSLLKLAHVLLAPLNKILARGFCRKPDEPENDENQSGETEEKEGTGMGEGEGQKDVSNQITDEEQLLGTKDEMEKEKNQEKPPKEENPDTDQGVEMDNDFEGDMHDVPSEDENEDGDDDKDKQELDREMGELGEDQNVVDEKMWDHSDDDDDQTPEEKEQKRQEEKYERDAPVHGAPEDDEIAAKEDQQNDKDENQPPEKDPAQEHAKEKEPKAAEDDQQPPQAEEDEDGEEEEPVGPINEDGEDKYEDKQGPDAMNNLPDDLALDDEEKEDKMDEGGDGEDEANDDGDEKMDEEGEGLDEDKQKQLEQEDGTEQDDGKGEDVGEEEDRADKVDEENPEADENQDPDNPDAPNAVEAPPAPEVDQSEDPNKEDDTQEPDVERPDKHADPDQKDTNQGAHRVAGGEQGHAGAEDEEKQEAKDDKKEAPPANDTEDRSDPNVNQDDQTVDQANSNDAAQGTESDWQPDAARSHPSQPEADQPKKKKQRKEKQAPNPFKSLGDANKQWLERLKILDDSKEENPEETQLEEASDNDEDGEGDDTMDGTFENAAKEEKADAQMLGPVEQKLDADEMPKIRPQADEDEKMDEEEDSKDKFQQEDQPPMTEEEKAQQDAANKQDKSRKRGGSQKLNPAQMDEDEEEDEDEDMSSVEEEEEDAALFDPFANADEEEEEPVESRIGAMDDIAQAKDVNPASNPNDPNHQAYLQQLRDDLDAAMQNWESSASSDPHQRAQDLWNKFADLTSELSASLTESLRMILEPMVATKLKGDYKTGKRINIKKIIPYIASSFRKDKIWLKRTKPNKRHYQVLITIDDSQSMKNNKAGRLALEAMTVLCKALSALEVGELAVASFGDQLKLLHPFTKPFTDDSGAFTVSNFQFQQQFTRWPDLLERTVSILDEARTIGGASSASADHHQLVFIISDARVQQDRETVSRWTREALSKNQLLVLIIVESGELKDSILSTKTVSYPNGKMKIADYLDDFPFPYYILLRDIQSLPEIVADALRQWFELVRATS